MNMDGALFHISPSDNNPWMYAARESSHIGMEACRRILERLLDRPHTDDRDPDRTHGEMARRPPSASALWSANRGLVTGDISFHVWVALVRNIVRMCFVYPGPEYYELPLDQVIYLLPIGYRLNYEDLADVAVRDVHHFSVAPTANHRGANPEGILRGVGALLSRFRDLPASSFRIPIMAAADSVGGVARTIIDVTRFRVNYYQWDNIVAASEFTHVETDTLTDDPDAGRTPVHF